MGTVKSVEEEAIMVAIVQEYYRCTNCGHDTKATCKWQH